MAAQATQRARSRSGAGAHQEPPEGTAVPAAPSAAHLLLSPFRVTRRHRSRGREQEEGKEKQGKAQGSRAVCAAVAMTLRVLPSAAGAAGAGGPCAPASRYRASFVSVLELFPYSLHPLVKQKCVNRSVPLRILLMQPFSPCVYGSRGAMIDITTKFPLKII